MTFTRRPALFVLLASALALLAGCRDRTDVWHCLNARRGACSQWTVRADPVTTKQQQEACREMGGTVGDGSCPEDGVIGSCLGGSGDSTRIVYYAPRGPSEAKAACQMLGGTWR